MNEYSWIGIALAFLAIFKGKDVWEYLKHRSDHGKLIQENTELKKIMEENKKEIEKLRRRVKKLEKM